MDFIKNHSGKSRYKILSLVLFLFLLYGFTISIAPDETKYISPEFLNVVKDQLIISDATGEKIIILDAEGKEIERIVELSGKPGRVSLSENGKRLFIPISEPDGKLAIHSFSKGKLISEIGVGHTPLDVVVTGDVAFVLNKFSNDVSIVDLKSQRELSRIPVIREPVGAVLSRDGNFLFIANSLPNMRSTDTMIAAGISIINTKTLIKEKDVFLPDGSNGLKDICLSNDGRFAYITHVLARYQLVTTQIERGWINTNAISIIDIENQEYYNTILLDDVDHGAANPWGITCSNNGESIYIALAGTHELCIIDRVGMHEKLEKVENGKIKSSIIRSPGDVKNDFSFLHGLKKRIKTKGAGSRGVAEMGGKVFVSEYFSGTISTFNRDEGLQSIPLGSQPVLSSEREGEMYFHDAELCFQQWQSCSSCHPDARTDGLNWDLLNDGMGNPKNTKSLVLSHHTPPVMIAGIRPDAKSAVRAGIKYILFAHWPEEYAKAIDAYLLSLQPVSSPRLVAGKLSQAAIRGKKVFSEAGCVTCHDGMYFSNLEKYDVGTGEGREKDIQFDTPSLNEAWRNAPYLYDGRALTLKEVITTYNKDDKHGKTSTLTDKQVADLAEYLESI